MAKSTGTVHFSRREKFSAETRTAIFSGPVSKAFLRRTAPRSEHLISILADQRDRSTQDGRLAARVATMSEIRIPIQLRWGDQDAYGHINNVAIMRILEEARARAFWSGSADPEETGILPPLTSGQPVWTLVADFQLKYRQQLDYQREPVIVEMSIPTIGGASFVINYGLRAAAEDPTPKITAASTLVMVDSATGRPQRIDAETRSRLRLWSGDDDS